MWAKDMPLLKRTEKNTIYEWQETLKRSDTESLVKKHKLSTSYLSLSQYFSRISSNQVYVHMYDISRRFNDCQSSADNCEKVEAILKRVLATFSAISLAAFLFLLPNFRRRISIYDPITAKIKTKTFFKALLVKAIRLVFLPDRLLHLLKGLVTAVTLHHIQIYRHLFRFQCYDVAIIQDFPQMLWFPEDWTPFLSTKKSSNWCLMKSTRRAWSSMQASST